MNIAIEKEYIIQQLSAVEDENMIAAIKAILAIGTKTPTKPNIRKNKLSDAQIIAKYAKPIHKKTDIEVLKKEQNYVHGKILQHRGAFKAELEGMKFSDILEQIK
jgi:hypothetical protein